MEIACFKEKNYPLSFRKIRNCPKELYIKGNSNLIMGSLLLGIVGSRKPSEYGKWVIKKLVSELKGFGITIISGFMYGIDSLAHKYALENNLKTIAVLPYGINYCPPNYQRTLYKEIINKGCIVSEYFGATSPQKWMFPQRNRIIAGLSNALLVIEAGENSGSLITAKFAKKYNKPIFAIPGEIFKPLSYGTNQLIKSGASIVTSSEDILNFYGFNSACLPKEPIFSSSEDTKLYKIISENPQTISNLAEKVDFPASEISYILTQMQLSGYIVEEKGIFRVS